MSAETVEVDVTNAFTGEVLMTGKWPVELWLKLEGRAKERGVTLSEHVRYLIDEAAAGEAGKEAT